jgi:predicted nucleotidyltransferase
MGGTSDRLRQRARRRADWLVSAAERLAADPDVVAAWVFGSEGRGDADELSDVDLMVALADDAAERRLPTIESTFREFGDVLGVEERPERAVEGGRAFVVTFPAPVEPLVVDWFCQAASIAPLGSDVRMLVDRGVLTSEEPAVPTASLLPGLVPGQGGAAPRRAARRAERLQERVEWFWSMAPVVAKWLARGWSPTAEAELQRMGHVVEEAYAFLGRQSMAQADGDRGSEGGGGTVQVRPLARLRAAIVELAALGSALEEAGLEVPPIDAAYGWLELAEDLEAEGWRPELTKDPGIEGVP